MVEGGRGGGGGGGEARKPVREQLGIGRVASVSFCKVRMEPRCRLRFPSYTQLLTAAPAKHGGMCPGFVGVWRGGGGSGGGQVAIYSVAQLALLTSDNLLTMLIMSSVFNHFQEDFMSLALVWTHRGFFKSSEQNGTKKCCSSLLFSK